MVLDRTHGMLGGAFLAFVVCKAIGYFGPEPNLEQSSGDGLAAAGSSVLSWLYQLVMRVPLVVEG